MTGVQTCALPILIHIPLFPSHDTGRELEPHDIFEAHERLNQYILNAKKETKSVRRQKSTKKHQEKTMEYESKVLDVTPKSQSKLNLEKQFNEEDDSDYEIYPIG